MSDDATMRLHGLGHDPKTRELVERLEALEGKVRELEFTFEARERARAARVRELEARVKKLETNAIFLEDPKLACTCGWSGTLTECEAHHTSAGDRAWTDFLCPECKAGLRKEYDPE